MKKTINVLPLYKDKKFLAIIKKFLNKQGFGACSLRMKHKQNRNRKYRDQLIITFDVDELGTFKE